MKKLIKILFIIALPILILLSCKSSIYYYSSDIYGHAFLKFCRNGYFYGEGEAFPMYSGKVKYIFGKWYQHRDTIYLDYLEPKIYYSYDSLAVIQETVSGNKDTIKFELHFPQKPIFFNIFINNNRFYPDSVEKSAIHKEVDTVEVVKFSKKQGLEQIKKFSIFSYPELIVYHKVLDTNANTFIIYFKKIPPKQLGIILLDAPTKFIKKRKKLIPIADPLGYLIFKRASNNKNKYFKKFKKCNPNSKTQNIYSN